MTSSAIRRAVPGPGRPPSTTRAQVSSTALELFTSRGFEQTTLSDVAAAIGIGRRTLFRYFPSKNDIVWGDFEFGVAELRAALARTDPAEPAIGALTRAVLASGDVDDVARRELRLRMGLIIDTPVLRAHAVVRYAEWQRVVARFVAARYGEQPEDIVPLMVAHMAFAAMMAAYLRWVRFPDESLEDHLRLGYARLAIAFDPPSAG